MDVREGMTLSGSAANYYLNRGISGSGSGPSPGAASGTGTPSGVPVSPGFKSLTNANIAVQSNIGSSSTGNVNSTYQVENPSPNFGHGINISMASSVSPSGSDPVKKKRGRPRKYGPDGTNMSLALSPLSSNPSSGGSITPGPKRIRGRPPGSGWKQQLAAVGEWMSSSAGLAFTPHVIHIGVGEDVAAKLLAFAQQRPRALCILSANGAVSAITLRPPASSGATVTYEGRFEILCLSGSYLVAENGGPRNRTGGISISVCSPDGHVIGGAIGGRLIAASPVQVVVCSFVYDPKVKSKPESTTPIKEEKESAEKSSTPIAATPSQDPTSGSGTGVWPPSSRPDVRNSQTGIDLTRG
ncbi:PREDICTED: AT-hook motif nuclear-localized protein 5-like isoform X1 [Nicotiana attenuata]|uniref:AT-hook motif nuclear-localized protein n=1 Tax=Nicotiana attenuata TaxID=49451 RepID=A0A314L3N8_NICAT|nr:PREDICTED: AT-hook motif nuclear-localized protein 5-like isoform X1 [Nicotiana attenuata]OIT36266.1 at-hook motif nuclear-localized protein 5 [Nicotiana attenuata]